MIRHTVIYKFKSNIPESNIAKIFNELSTLQQHIEGVVSFHWGACIGSKEKSQGYTHMISVDLKDESVFREYSPHPIHNAAREAMTPLLDNSLPLIMFDIVLQGV